MIHFETINEAGDRLVERIKREGLRVEGEAIVFVGALGICVRRLQGLVHDKHSDPAVVCIDSSGRWVISVLSGHLGGANELARQIARMLGAQAIVTTQSDNQGLWALDLLAEQNGWTKGRISHEEMNRAIATFVNRRPTALVVECDDKGARRMIASRPAHVSVFRNIGEYQRRAPEQEFELLLIVSPHLHTPADTTPTLRFFPRTLHLGVGCQKEAPEEIAPRLLDEIRALGFVPESIATLSSIELKRDEPLMAALVRALPQARLEIFRSEELAQIPVPHPSQKVFQATGSYGVAEAAALACCRQGRLVVEKQKGCLALGERTWHYTFALAEKDPTQGHIEIVGAGPGDPELVSVRGRRFLEQADLILYAGSLVPRELTACAKEGAVVRNSATMNLEEQFALMKEFYDRGALIVRLHTGDPSLYGAIQEQMALFDRHGMNYHITPGISSFLAAAAELRCQYTIPERCQTVILTRGEGHTAVPQRERLRSLAAHGSTMCIFLSASLASEVQGELLAGGLSPKTPVAVCHRLTWPDQKIFRGQLRDLASLITDNHLTLTTMIVVGEAIDNREGLSRLYDSHFTHLFRQGKTSSEPS